jgi:probable selenium-dependent hydroxylase accessory protein YqeC
MGTPLATGLGVGAREVVVLVGGGGKTTTMFRLGRELRELGRSVVVTTTTHIFAPGPEPDLETILLSDKDNALAECGAVLARGRLPVLGTRVTPDGKLAGVLPDVVDQLAASEDLTYVVVEADGSAHKPFKAPLEYEPVVPSSTTLLIAVVGVDALGQPLDAEHIHRPGRVAELSGLPPGSPLSSEAIASVLVHRLGPLRDAPPGARTLVLLNKADTRERLAAAREIARAVRVADGPETLISAVAAAEPFPA